MSVAPLLPKYTNPPIRQRTFKNGVAVLHTPKYLHENFSARLAALLANGDPKTLIDIARAEDMGVGVVQQMVEDVEDEGKLLRDEPGGYEVTRWSANRPELWVYDGTP